LRAGDREQARRDLDELGERLARVVDDRVEVAIGARAELSERRPDRRRDADQRDPAAGEEIGQDGAGFGAFDDGVDGVDDGFEAVEALDALDDCGDGVVVGGGAAGDGGGDAGEDAGGGVADEDGEGDGSEDE